MSSLHTELKPYCEGRENKQPWLFACCSVKTLTGCRTACQTLRSVYWAGGDTGQLRMSAWALFSPQLPSVTASCLKRTIFVSLWNYHHLVIFSVDCFLLYKAPKRCCPHVTAAMPLVLPADSIRNFSGGKFLMK